MSKPIKISFVNSTDIKSTVIFHLIKKISKKKIEISDIKECDILFIGPYNYYSVKNKIYNFFIKKFLFFNTNDYIKFNRKTNPIKIFYSTENFRHDVIDADYYITSDLGINDKNHLRMAPWKNYVDWSHEGVFREKSLNAIRLGFFYKIEDLMKPQGNDFLKKKRKVCFFTSHLNEPRRSIYLTFSKNFIVKGFGPYFNKNIKNHNKSNFLKIDIMKNYAYNLCPENSLFPGYYTEKIPDAFLGRCLPISWSDQNINYDFNPKSFVNLLDYTQSNYKEIIELLKDDSFLKKYSKQPLLLKRINLDSEIKFVEKILNNL
jgi:hypothetical protein